MGKIQRSVIKEKWPKIKGLRSEKYGKKSKVSGQGKMGKSQSSTVKEKWEKIIGPRTEKKGKNSKVRG